MPEVTPVDRLDRLYSIVFDALSRQQPLNELILVLHGEFGVSFWFCDVFGRISVGTVTDKFITYFKQLPQSSLHRSLSSGGCYNIAAGELDEGAYVVAPVGTGKDGMIVIAGYGAENETLAQEAALLLGRLYVYYSRELRRKVTANMNSMGRLFARELLLSGDGMVMQMLEKNQSTFLSFRPGYCVMSFRPEDPARLPAVISGVRDIFPSSYVIEHEDSVLVFAYGLQRAISHTDTGYVHLRELCERLSAFCCISELFDDLMLRRGYVEQVQRILALAIKLNHRSRVVYTHELLCEYMCSSAAQQLGADMIQLTAIDYISRYDAKNGTDYLNTLSCYLRHSNSLSAAAKELFIDRTTLKYRIGRIKDIMLLDIDEPKNARSLRIGLIVHRVCG